MPLGTRIALYLSRTRPLETLLARHGPTGRGYGGAVRDSSRRGSFFIRDESRAGRGEVRDRPMGNRRQARHSLDGHHPGGWSAHWSRGLYYGAGPSQRGDLGPCLELHGFELGTKPLRSIETVCGSVRESNRSSGDFVERLAPEHQPGGRLALHSSAGPVGQGFFRAPTGNGLIRVTGFGSIGVDSSNPEDALVSPLTKLARNSRASAKRRSSRFYGKLSVS